MKDILIGLTVFLVCWYIPIILYLNFGTFKRWFHGVLEWHRPDKTRTWNDGRATYSQCKWCGKEIMRDSQGNWLVIDGDDLS